MVGIDITGQNFLISSAISHIASQNPMNRMPIRGGAIAMKSAAMQGMRKEVDPSKMTDKQKVIIEKLGNRTIMKVKFGFKPMNQKSATTARTSIVGVTGTSPVQGVETTVAYDMYHQSDAIEQSPIDQIQSELLDGYYKKWASGGMSLPQLLAAVQDSSFGNVALTIWENAMNGIFPAQANALMAKLFLAVGSNPAFPAAVLPSAAAPVVQLNGFLVQQGQLVADPVVVTALRKMKMKSKTSGRPVLIGGDKWLAYHDLQGIMAVNSTIGVDSTQYVKRLDHDFYYDEMADALFGTDVAVWIEPDAICEVPWTYYGTGQLPDDQMFRDVYFTEVNANLKQYMPLVGMGYNQNEQNVAMSFDLRIARKLDTGDFPRFTYQMNACNGLWTRPINFFTTDATNPLKNYTGICALQLMG